MAYTPRGQGAGGNLMGGLGMPIGGGITPYSPNQGNFRQPMSSIFGGGSMGNNYNNVMSPMQSNYGPSFMRGSSMHPGAGPFSATDENVSAPQPIDPGGTGKNNLLAMLGKPICRPGDPFCR